MDKYDRFQESISIAAERFKELNNKETIRLVSHLDADGISACSVMIKLLSAKNMKYSVSIVSQLTTEIVKGLSSEPYHYFIFTDLGSGAIGDIKKYLSDRTVFIFDHHKPGEKKGSRNIIHINPHLHGIDGGSEICGAGVIYLFAEKIDKKIKEMAHIPIIGAIGDVQENNGFLKLNKEILCTAVNQGKIKVMQGLRLFGAHTKPIHKVLEYCTDPYIPGVTGSEEGALEFLKEININIKDKKGYRKVPGLTKEETERLVAGIILRRSNEKNPDDIMGNIYILADEELDSPLRDAKEFATLLNSCGRLGKSSLGIGACLGNKKMKGRAMRNMDTYKKEIMTAMKWYEKHKISKYVISNEHFLIINAKENIMPTIAGTIASIISKSNLVKPGTLVMTMARQIDDSTKVSLRVGGKENNGTDLRKIIKEISDCVSGQCGGHRLACGAIIATSKEKEFVEKAKVVLSKAAIEEVV